MKNTMDKIIKIGVWTTSILFVIRCLIGVNSLIELWNTGEMVDLFYNVIGYIGEAIAAGFILIKIYDLWAWKWRFVRWTHDIPILAPAYKGTLSSSYKDGKEYKGVLTIKQTFTKMSISFKSNESSSVSIVADIIDNHDMKQLIYTYQNDPKANIQERSPIHHGTAILNVDNVEKIEGNYFTERGSHGYMTFSAVHTKKKKSKKK